MQEEDPCETCLFKIRCREFCEEGTEYHKKQIFLSLGETNLRHFKLDALLLIIPLKIEEFLQKYPSLEGEIDDIQDGAELLKRMNLLNKEKNGSMKSKETKKRDKNRLIKRMNLLRRKREGSEKTEKRNKNKKTMRLNLFVRKNNGKKNLFKSFLSRLKN